MSLTFATLNWIWQLMKAHFVSFNELTLFQKHSPLRWFRSDAAEVVRAMHLSAREWVINIEEANSSILLVSCSRVQSRTKVVSSCTPRERLISSWSQFSISIPDLPTMMRRVKRDDREQQPYLDAFLCIGWARLDLPSTIAYLMQR